MRLHAGASLAVLLACSRQDTDVQPIDVCRAAEQRDAGCIAGTEGCVAYSCVERSAPFSDTELCTPRFERYAPIAGLYRVAEIDCADASFATVGTCANEDTDLPARIWYVACGWSEP